MKPQYLYFPSCKIVNINKINLTFPKIIFYLKANTNTPYFYPKHAILKGKAEFIFTINIDEVDNNSNYKKELHLIFNQHITDLKNIKKLKKKNIGLLAFFNPEHSIICDCFGIGQENKSCNFFNNENTDNKNLARMVYLEHNLLEGTNKQNDKLVKI